MPLWPPVWWDQGSPQAGPPEVALLLHLQKPACSPPERPDPCTKEDLGRKEAGHPSGTGAADCCGHQKLRGASRETGTAKSDEHMQQQARLRPDVLCSKGLLPGSRLPLNKVIQQLLDYSFVCHEVSAGAGLTFSFCLQPSLKSRLQGSARAVSALHLSHDRSTRSANARPATVLPAQAPVITAPSTPLLTQRKYCDTSCRGGVGWLRS